MIEEKELCTLCEKMFDPDTDFCEECMMEKEIKEKERNTEI